MFKYLTLCANSDSETPLCHGQQKDIKDDEAELANFFNKGAVSVDGQRKCASDIAAVGRSRLK